MIVMTVQKKTVGEIIGKTTLKKRWTPLQPSIVAASRTEVFRPLRPAVRTTML